MDVVKTKLLRDALADQDARRAIADAVQLSPEQLASESPKVTVDGKQYKIVIGKPRARQIKK